MSISNNYKIMLVFWTTSNVLQKKETVVHMTKILHTANILTL